MKRISIQQIITVFATLATITVNGLANALPINGQGTGEISDRFEIFFVPSGYVFGIWGVIYLGLLGFTIYQALPAQRDDQLLKKIGPAYWLGSLANILWIFLWHYEFFSFTWIAMITILATLIYIYQQISTESSDFNSRQKWLIRLPFSIYLGWISVATIANITQVLFYFDWNGWGIDAAVWAVLMIAIATLLGLLMLLRENEIPYLLVLVWAFVGIAQKQSGEILVAYSAWIAAGLLILLLGVKPILNRWLSPQASK